MTTSQNLCKWNYLPDGSVICPVCNFRYHKPVHYVCKGKKSGQDVSKAEFLDGRQERREQQARREGPGTELKRLLRKIGIVPTANCKCNKRAALMDVHGSDWCEEHLEEVVDWLEEESVSRRLPFVRLAARTLVKLSIHRARKGARLYP